MSTSAAENITFMVVRGIVALAIVGMGFYCIAQGIHFFALPRVEAEQIRIHLIGLDISASGLGAVIFGVGLALSYLGKRTAPNKIQTTRNIETIPPATPPQGGTQPQETGYRQDAVPEVVPVTAPMSSFPTRISEGTVVAEGPDGPNKDTESLI